MHIAPYIAAFGFLTIFHAIQVIRLRWKHRVPLGSGGNLELERMIRVHGNHSEYVPMGLILLFALEYMEAPVLFIHLVGTTFLIGRIFHGIGLGRSPGPSKERVVGMIVSLTSLALGSLGVLIFSFWLRR